MYGEASLNTPLLFHEPPSYKLQYNALVKQVVIMYGRQFQLRVKPFLSHYCQCLGRTHSMTSFSEYLENTSMSIPGFCKRSKIRK